MPEGRFERMTVNGEASRVYVHDAQPKAPGVVVFHAWWGLNDDVIAYADRLAAAGFCVQAPDLVRGRVATTIPDAERLAEGKDETRADAAALAAIDRLTRSGERKAIGAVGFSMGAAWSLWSAAQRPTVAASVVYYGTMRGPSLAIAKVPVLGHFAESDPYEPEDIVTGFERALRDANRSVAIHRYSGTGHWFAEPSRDAWRREAADLAFDRTVEFLRQHVR